MNWGQEIFTVHPLCVRCQDTSARTVNKTNKTFCPHGAFILEGERDNTQANSNLAEGNTCYGGKTVWQGNRKYCSGQDLTVRASISRSSLSTPTLLLHSQPHDPFLSGWAHSLTPTGSAPGAPYQSSAGPEQLNRAPDKAKTHILSTYTNSYSFLLTLYATRRGTIFNMAGDWPDLGVEVKRWEIQKGRPERQEGLHPIPTLSLHLPSAILKQLLFRGRSPRHACCHHYHHHIAPNYRYSSLLPPHLPKSRGSFVLPWD